jgi:O-antigen/teichoic acid export membrane protein
VAEKDLRDEPSASRSARNASAEAQSTGRLESTRTRPPLVSSTFLAFITQVASSAFALANVFIIARSLGPTGRGEVAFLITISATLSNLGAFGVQEANINFASAQPGLRRALATNSILIAGFAGAAVAAATAAIATVVPIFGSDARIVLIAFALASVPLQLLKMYLWRFVQADYRFGIASLSWTLPYVANFLANAALALVGALTVGTAFATWLAAQVVPLVFLGWHIARRLEGFGRPDFSLARRTMKFGLQTHLYKIMSMGNTRLDQWILGVLGNTRELGLYSVAVSLSTSLYQVPSALDLAQRPDLARASKEGAARRASVAFRIAASVTATGAVILAIFAPFICVGLLGSDFRGSIDDLRVLMLGAVGMVALKLLGNALTAQGRPLLVSVGVAAGLIVTIVLDVLLIPRFGGLGAAIASVVAYSTVGAVVSVMFLRALDGRAADLLPRPRDAALLLAQFRRLLAFRAAGRTATAGPTADRSS